MSEDVAVCAKCGLEKGLCQSVRIDGIKQPRICKDCLFMGIQTGDYEINDVLWLLQLNQLNDNESLDNLQKQSN